MVLMSKTVCKYNTVLMGHAITKIKAIIVDKKLHQVFSKESVSS